MDHARDPIGGRIRFLPVRPDDLLFGRERIISCFAAEGVG
jgi:hypothetical protein